MVSKTTGIIIAVFLVALMGTILVTIISEQTILRTTKLQTGQEAHAITRAYATEHLDTEVNLSTLYTVTQTQEVWKQESCPLANFDIRNATGGNELTVDTDYTVNLTYGTFRLLNTSATKLLYPDNSTYLTYDYCDDGYLNSDWGRTILNLLPGFFALAILVGAAFVIFKIAKEEGFSLD